MYAVVIVAVSAVAACGAPQAPREVAAPREPAPPETLIGRRLVTGTNTESSLETFTLTIDGERVELIVRTRTAPRAFPAAATVGGWGAERVETVRGTARRTGHWLELDLGARSMMCERERAAVARAHAVRVPARAPSGECPRDRGTWSPADQVTVEALDCVPPDVEEILDHMVTRFARAPGVERLELVDVCGLVGAGWREIPADGTLAPVR